MYKLEVAGDFIAVVNQTEPTKRRLFSTRNMVNAIEQCRRLNRDANAAKRQAEQAMVDAVWSGAWPL